MVDAIAVLLAAAGAAIASWLPPARSLAGSVLSGPPQSIDPRAAPPRQAVPGPAESPCGSALRRGTVCETPGEEASRWLALRQLAGAALMQDVHTGALVALTAAPAPASSVAGAATAPGGAVVAGSVDVATPLLPLSLAKVFLAASYWDRAAALPPGAGRDLHEMLVDGSDSIGRRLAIDLRRAAGSAAVVADLRRFGFQSCSGAGASAPLPDDRFWRELAPRFVQRLRPATACVSIGPGDPDTRWASALSIGEDGLTVTLLHVSRFLQAVGNGGLLVRPLARWDGGDGRDREDRDMAPRPPPRPEGARIVAVSTAARLQAALSDAVLRGSASGIRGLPGHGWTMGGKTGTGPAEALPHDGCFAGLVFDERGMARYTIASYVRRGGRGGGAAAQLAAELAARALGLPGASAARP